MEKFDSLRQEMEGCPPIDGIVASDIMTLPEGLRPIFNRLVRKSALTVVEFASEFGLTPDQARQLGDGLVQRGYLKSEVRETDGETVYRLRLARTRQLRPPPAPA